MKKPAFSKVLCHGRITYYTGTIFQDCHKRTHWHELQWHEQLVSWKSQVKINKHLWRPSFEAKFITGRCELMSNFNWSAVVSSRRLEAKIMTTCGEIKLKVQSNWYAFMVPRCVNLSDDSCFQKLYVSINISWYDVYIYMCVHSIIFFALIRCSHLYILNVHICIYIQYEWNVWF